MATTRISHTRVRALHLIAAAVLGCMVISGAQAISPPVKNNYITLTPPAVAGDFAGLPNVPAGAIQALSLSFGASCIPSTAGSGPVCSRASIGAPNIIKATDGASPKLFLGLVSGTTYPTATFQFWEAPTSGVNFTKTYTIILTRAFVQSFTTEASQGDGFPTESVAFGFETVMIQDNVYGSVSCYNTVTGTSSSASTC